MASATMFLCFGFSNFFFAIVASKGFFSKPSAVLASGGLFHPIVNVVLVMGLLE